jgi:hypothetical protein
MDGGLSCLIIATSILIIGVNCDLLRMTIDAAEARIGPGSGLSAPAPFYFLSYWQPLLSATSRFNRLVGLLVQ